MACLSRSYSFKFLRGCLSQTLLCPRLSFVNFTEKLNDNDFVGFTFYKKAYKIYFFLLQLLAFIMFKLVKVGKYIEHKH